MSNDIDLIERPDLWSEELTDLLMKYYPDADDSIDYNKLEELLKEVNEIGYTFDYGLDGIIFDLKKL